MRANIFLAALLILAYITISSTYAIEMSGGMSISSADEPCFGEGIFLQDADGSISSMESSGHIDYHQCHWVYDMPEKFAKVQLDVDNGIVDNYGFYVYPNEDITSDSNYVRAYQNFEVEDASNINALASASNIEGGQAQVSIGVVDGSISGWNNAFAYAGHAATIQNVNAAKGKIIEITGSASNSEQDYADTCISISNGKVIDLYNSAYATLESSSSYGHATTYGENVWVNGNAVTKKSEYDQDSSTTSIAIQNADNMYVTTGTSAKNSYGGLFDLNTYHRTEATADAIGYASYVVANSYAEYQNSNDNYFANAYGKWGSFYVESDVLATYGDMNIGAKTVKSAVADIELKTDGDIDIDGELVGNRATDYLSVRTTSGKWDETLSGLCVETVPYSDSVDKFQAHMYSHAYPRNDHHDIDEYVSTTSTGIDGEFVLMDLDRWDERTNEWVSDKLWGYNPDNFVFRSTDTTTTEYRAGYPWTYSLQEQTWDYISNRDDFSYLSEDDEVPWGIESIYNGNLDSDGHPSGGRGVDVAVIDTGCDTLHPDLVMRVEDYADLTVDKPVEYGLYDFDSAGNGKADPIGHGTHVSGTIVADGGFDGVGIWGMAPDADLHVYRVASLGSEDRYLIYSGTVRKAIYRATDLGSDIISLSLGGSVAVDSVLNPAIEYAADNGVLMVASAGNGVSNGDSTILYPAANSNVIAVGAVDSMDQAMWWSSPGYNDDDEYIGEVGEVMFGAPGLDVVSTSPRYKTEYSDIGYDTKSGTSMATPHVSGLAAKLWSENEQYYADAASITGLMQSYAKNNDVTSANLNTAAWYGSLIDLYKNYYAGEVPGDYYAYVSLYIDGQNPPNDIFEGEDCLTGLGIPKLPKPEDDQSAEGPL